MVRQIKIGSSNIGYGFIWGLLLIVRIDIVSISGYFIRQNRIRVMSANQKMTKNTMIYITDSSIHLDKNFSIDDDGCVRNDMLLGFLFIGSINMEAARQPNINSIITTLRDSEL